MSGKRVCIELNGTQRWLHYDLNTIALIHERTGLNLLSPEPNFAITPAVLRTMVWAGLLDGDATLTEATVGRWIDFENIMPVIMAVFALFPTQGGEAAGAPDPTIQTP